MGFWQQQKINAAIKYLRWQYEKQQRPLPADAELERQARALVDEAQQIARRTGRNVLVIVKDLIKDLKK
jgi:hypothetical protein